MSLKRGLGCLVGVVALFAVLTVCVAGGAWWYVSSTVDALDSSPKPLPIPEISEETEREISEATSQIAQFIEAGQGGEVSLSQTALNGWLRLTDNTNLRFIGEHARLTMSGSRMTADVSIPLAPLNAPGRFFNGQLRLSGDLKDGIVSLFIDSIALDRGSSRALNILERILKGRNISDSAGLEELINPALLERCSVFVERGRLVIGCRAKSAS